jgi:hypothetical protein
MIAKLKVISVAINLVFVHSVSTDFLIYYLIHATEIKDINICRPRAVFLVLGGAISGFYVFRVEAFTMEAWNECGLLENSLCMCAAVTHHINP